MGCSPSLEMKIQSPATRVGVSYSPLRTNRVISAWFPRLFEPKSAALRGYMRSVVASRLGPLYIALLTTNHLGLRLFGIGDRSLAQGLFNLHTLPSPLSPTMPSAPIEGHLNIAPQASTSVHLRLETNAAMATYICTAQPCK